MSDLILMTLEALTRRYENREGGLRQVGEPRPPRNERELVNRKAPINHLPDELLLEIWKHSCQHLLGKEAVLFPFVMSWVTRRWRYVAIGAPTLWRHIEILPTRSAELVEAMCHRSKSCSLDVVVQVYRRRGHVGFFVDDYDRVAEILTIALRHVERWCSLDVQVGASGRTAARYHPDRVKKMLLPLRDAYAPRLHDLYLDIEDPLGPHLDVILGGGAPALSKVTLSGANLRLNRPVLTGLNLTSLYLEALSRDCRPTHGEFRDLLVASPGLKDLTINGECVDYCSERGRACQRTTIRSDSLVSLGLTVIHDRHDFISQFFSVFSTPSLQLLSLTLDPDLLIKFIHTLDTGRPKYPQVSDLQLYDDDDEPVLSVDELLKLVRGLPSIEKLTLGTSITNHLMEAMTRYEVKDSGASDEALWPNLSIVLLPYSEINIHILREFVIKRESLKLPFSQLCVEESFFEALDDGEQAMMLEDVKVQMLCQ